MLEQESGLLDLLDPLGMHLHPHALRQGNDHSHNRRVIFITRQPGDEALVDLEFLHRQSLEPQQRRISRAEIVDGQPHTQLAQAMHLLQRHLRILHHCTFGHFQLQIRRIKPRRIKHLSNLLIQLASGKQSR